MRVAITGASGTIGSALTRRLVAEGHVVTRLVRREPSAATEVRWDPDHGDVDLERLEGIDAIVHLAGEPIESRRWDAEQKRRIRDSRVHGTRVVARAVADLPRRPALVCASGVNYYGDGGDEARTEDAGAGADFMAEVCVAWERAADAARSAGARVVHLRTGIVLDPAGGALARMLPFARLGLLGALGSGRQYWSWISLDDVVGAYVHALTTDGLDGPVNATAPNPMRQRDFARTLNRVLGRPTFPLPAPRLAPRLLYGEMADALVFTSLRVLPERLQSSGYVFRHPALEGGLRQALGR